VSRSALRLAGYAADQQDLCHSANERRHAHGALRIASLLIPTQRTRQRPGSPRNQSRLPRRTLAARHSGRLYGWIVHLRIYSAPPTPSQLALRSMYPRIARLALVPGLLAALARGQTPQRPRSDVHCAPDNGGITLPQGFCATVFADTL